jgi:hypothetical protein
MKKLIIQFLTVVFILMPVVIKSQSSISLDAGTIMEIQTGADACSDTRTLNGLLTGNGSWCLFPLTPVSPLPVSPANFSVGQNPSLNLVWQKTLGAVFYHVQLSTDSLFGSLIVNDSTLTDSIRAVSGLNPLTNYWWRVSAKGIGGKSAFSSVFKFKTLGYPVPVTLINPPNNAANQPISILFRWSRALEQTAPFGVFANIKSTPIENKVFTRPELSEGIDAIGNYWFDLVTDTVSLANLTRDTILTDTTKSVGGLSNLTNYYWRVRAKNQFGWGAYSVWFKFTTIVAVPSAPVLVSPLNNAVGQNLSFTLVWNKSSTAETYRVQVASDSLFSGIVVNDSTLTDSTKVISGLNPLTNYWWRVSAKNIGGTSIYSSVWKFKTLGTPYPVTLVNPPNNAVNQPVSIQFRWSRALEQTNPLGVFDNIKSAPVEKKIFTHSELSEGIDAIGNYWFDLVTDTISLANLTRDSILTDTTKSVSGLTNLTNYYWRVRAKDAIGWGQFSAWWKFTTILAAPVAPVLVSPTNNAVGQNLSLMFVWQKSSTAVTYRVQVASDSLFSGIIVNDSTLTDSTKVISGLNPLTYYWWRVNAKNIGGTSSYSTIYKFRTLGYPNTVTLINPANNAVNQPTSIVFRWNRALEQTNAFEVFANIKSTPNENKVFTHSELSEGIDAIGNYWFDLVTDTVSLANLTRDSILTDTTKSVSGLTNLTNYYWRVRAKNAIGWGQFSIWWRFTTIVAAPSAPVLVSPANGANGQPLTLTIVWRKSINAASYRLQIATDAGFNTLILNDSTLTDSLRLVSGLTQLTTYYWRVNAKDIGGTGPYSTIWSFTTLNPLVAPTLISPLNNATNVIQAPLLDWSDATTATYYRVQASTNSGFTGTLAINQIVSGVSQYQVPGGTLALNTQYYWRVKAFSATDSTAYTAAFNFTTENGIIVNLTIIPGGFFNSSTNKLNMRDTLRILLIDTISGGHRVDSCKVVVDSALFTCQAKFNIAQNGTYYIYIYHRNHLPVACALPLNFSRSAPTSYNFTDAANKTYGSNVIQVSTSPARWGMIPGDANQDEYVDAFDQFIWIAQNGLDGYLSADFNGDTYVDAFDQFIWIAYNGNSSFLPVIFPGPTQTSPIRNSQGVKKTVIDNRQIDFNKQKDFKNQNDLKK